MLCGAKSVQYTNYPNNVVHKFYKQASKFGVEVFCAFNYLNYINNLKLSIDSAVSTGGFLEGTLSHTGGISDPKKGKCDLEYFIKLTRDISNMGVHSLAINNTTSLLNPRSATMLL